jgi:hypothetical protein
MVVHPESSVAAVRAVAFAPFDASAFPGTAPVAGAAARSVTSARSASVGLSGMIRESPDEQLWIVAVRGALGSRNSVRFKWRDG